MCIVELTEIVLFVYFHTSPVHHKDNLHTMDPFLGPNPPKECSHSTCHKIIPSTEAGIKQYKICEDCWGQDAAARKRKRQNAKAAGQATTQASEEASTKAPTGMLEDRPSMQKQWRTLGLTFLLDSSDGKHDSVSIGLPGCTDLWSCTSGTLIVDQITPMITLSNLPMHLIPRVHIYILQ